LAAPIASVAPVTPCEVVPVTNGAPVAPTEDATTRRIPTAAPREVNDAPPEAINPHFDCADASAMPTAAVFETSAKASKVSDRAQQIIRHLEANQRITRLQASQICRTSIRTASRDLAELVSQGLLKGDGRGGKTAGYVLASGSPGQVCPSRQPPAQSDGAVVSTEVAADQCKSIGAQGAPKTGRSSPADRERQIIMHVEANQRITRRQASRICGTSIRTASRDLAAMVARGILEKDGRGGKTAGYAVAVAPPNRACPPTVLPWLSQDAGDEITMKGTASMSDTGIRAADGLEILIVDDNKALRFALRETLLRKGRTVEEADSAEAALKLALAKDFDAALVDINLGTMSGLDFLAAVKQERPNMSVVIITGVAT
jgi:CheY-like chemotaxis protein